MTVKKHKIRFFFTFIGATFLIFVFLLRFKGYLFSRAILSHDLSFMYHAITRTIISQIPPEKRNIPTELDYINRYINLNVHSFGKVRDDGASWILIYGEGWCDSVANIFIQLITPLDIRGYLIFLKLPNGESPHSVAYCALEDLSIKDIEYLQKKAVVVDPQNGIIYHTAEGDFSSPSQICDGQARIPKRLSSHRSYYCEKPRIFVSNQPISTQPNIKRWFYRNVFPRIPKGWIKQSIRVSLALNNRLEDAERLYYLARLEQLFLNYSGATEGYAVVIERYSKTRWGELASYWRDRLSYPENRFPEMNQ